MGFELVSKQMTGWRWFLGLGVVLFAFDCTPVSGALGADGYEQSLTKYRVNYADKARRKFLPDDWLLDNFAYDSSRGQWLEKNGEQYRAERRLDEDGDGTISRHERRSENIFDLRFVNTRDNAVIWVKVHPLEPAYAGRDLDVMLENYASGLEGTGLFEQSTLFGLEVNRARHFTTFTVKKEATTLGPLPAIVGVLEIADVEKLRLDSTHRDSKAELTFAKVTYRQTVRGKSMLPWPVVSRTGGDQGTETVYQCTGLLVVGYYNDAARFDAHVADVHSLLSQIVIPASAVPAGSSPRSLASAPPSAVAPTPAPSPAAPTPAAASAAPAPAASAVASAPVTTAPAVAVPAASTPSAPALAPPKK
ncbi:MAG TPA: hypothetical protein VHM25_00285 [Polyangiaceae bacterium]|jgi:hypothetical protein|nr:hypothetical protein [Polyangiaceae bacterium]